MCSVFNFLNSVSQESSDFIRRGESQHTVISHSSELLQIGTEKSPAIVVPALPKVARKPTIFEDSMDADARKSLTMISIQVNFTSF